MLPGNLLDSRLRIVHVRAGRIAHVKWGALVNGITTLP
jgi:hypothetical protein